MIRVDELQIEEFRGIRSLTLSFNRKNFAICGPNGTGKSGIVDALEFVLTGEISRLSGQGTGGLSVKAHGPHVDVKQAPGKAFVKLAVFIPALNRAATILRTVKDAKSPVIEPATPEVLAAFQELARHPEVVLSRRELIRFVLSEPGRRAEEVQALLRLEDLEKLRTSLQRIANSSERERLAAERAQKAAEEALARGAGLAHLKAAELLVAVNARRFLLDLPALDALQSDTSVRDGLSVPAPEGARRVVSKALALRDLAGAQEALQHLRSEQFTAAVNEALDALGALEDAGGADRAAEREQYLRQTLTLFDGVECPACATPWNADDFRRVLHERQQQLRRIAELRAAVGRAVEAPAAAWEGLANVLADLNKQALLLPDPDASATISQAVIDARALAAHARRVLPIEQARSSLAQSRALPELSAAMEALHKRFSALPDASERDNARDYLTLVQERLETFRTAKRELQVCAKRAATSKQAFELYGKAVTTELEAIYDAVQKRFVALYRIVNHDDEGAFEARLLPTVGKLSLDVDFYGRGFFPPGAYHSEGHQDGMGLCLYLALMDHLLGKQFTFAVLDDVLMSVDAGHRREVSRLLKQEFPHTQFILTTHDEIWLKHMKSEGLVAGRGAVHFRKWTVDVGPAQWDDKDVWTELDELLSKHEVRAAAALLRHYLEHLGTEAAQRLRARVEFRADNLYTLGDTFPQAVNAYSEALKKGRAAANYWKQAEKEDELKKLEEIFRAARDASNVDQWQVNAAVHYNEWATLHPNDFRPVVNAFRGLIQTLTCSTCHEVLYVSPERGEKESLRCGCGSTNINLRGKP